MTSTTAPAASEMLALMTLIVSLITIFVAIVKLFL